MRQYLGYGRSPCFCPAQDKAASPLSGECQALRNDGKWVDYVEKLASEIGAGASLILALRLRPRLCGGCGGWHGDQLGHFPEVLGGGCEEGLVPCAVWTSQAQAIHSEDALEVREQHFDLLALAARDEIGVGGGDIAGEIPGALVDCRAPSWTERSILRAGWVGQQRGLRAQASQSSLLER